MAWWPKDTPKAASPSEKERWGHRMGDEAGHRHVAWLNAGQLVYEPSIQDMNIDTASPPKCSVRDFLDVCNKSVPIYAPTDERWHLLAITLHNYIYRRWFRPYRSELEYGQFICKFFAIHSLPDLPVAKPVVKTILSFNERLCARVEACRPVYDAAQPETMDLTTGLHLPKDHVNYQTRPLFRALLIIVDSKEYHFDDTKTIGDMRVSLVRTGIEDGLSAPIPFEAIQRQAETESTDSPNVVTTTLRTAVDFVITLENRERAASTSVPVPDARYLRWWKFNFGDEPVIYPSSRLVTDENAAEWGWCGDGKDYDTRLMVAHEQRIRKRVTRCFELQTSTLELPSDRIR